MRNGELQLSFSWRNNCQEGPKSPTPIRVSLTQGKAPLLLQLLPTPWEICSFSLENQAILLNMFFRLSRSHSPAFLAITGLQSHFCFLISCTVLKPYDTVWNTGFQVWLLPPKDTMSSCSSSEIRRYFTCQQSCVYVLRYIFIAATSADGWNGGCHFAFQTSNAPPLIRCFHVLGLKKCCFFQWVTPMPTQLGTWAGDCQLQKRQQNLETRRWSPQALNFTKTEKRKRNHLPASACAAGTSSFCISISSLHGTWACTRWKMGHQPSPVRRCRANSLLSPESARQMLTR